VYVVWCCVCVVCGACVCVCTCVDVVCVWCMWYVCVCGMCMWYVCVCGVCVWWCLRLTVSHPWLRPISPQHFLLVMMPTCLSLPAYVWTEWLQDWSGSITVCSKCEGVWTLGHLQCNQYSVQSKGCVLIFSYKLLLVECWCSWCEKVQ